MTFRKLLIAAAGLAVCAGAGAASAQTQWQASHPLRTEVNQRQQHMENQITHDQRTGQISRRQAYRDRVGLRMIRREERVYARRHGGHIGYAEQARLNRQENRIRADVPPR